MKKNSGYMTRALRSKDRRYQRILGKLGYTAPLEGPKIINPVRVAAPVEPTPESVEPQMAAEEEAPTPVDETQTETATGEVDEAALIVALREQYTALAGKRPFNGWDKDELLEKIVKLESEKD